MKDALRLDTNNADVYFRLGVIYEKQGRLQEAVESFQKVLKCIPNKIEVHRKLVGLFWQQKRFTEEADASQAIIEINARESLVEVNSGLVKLRNGSFGAARRCFEDVIRIKSESAETYCNVGVALSWTQKWGEAVDAFQLALQEDPHSARALMNLGLLLERKDPSTARLCYTRLVELLWE